MTLLEILHVISDEKKKGLVNVDDWKWADADHLKSMGFEFDGDYTLSLKSPPITVYKKKASQDEGDQKTPSNEYFVIEEEGKQTQVFRNFEEVVKYFDTYPQPEIDKERE